MNIIAKVAAPLLVISACTPTADSVTHSGFQTPSSTGAIATSLTNSRRGSDFNASGDGYAYAVGSGSNGNFYGYAGIVPTTAVSAPLTAGRATFNGRYELARITDITLSGQFLFGTSSLASGGLSLTADFDARTLTGGNALLSVDGVFVGSNLTGSVNYLGLNGALTGLVGSTGAVGAFHGDSGTDIYAGGFIVGTP